MKKQILVILVVVFGLATGLAKAGYVFGEPEYCALTVFPSLSPDELTMFCVGQEGGYGGDDLKVSTRPTKHDDWGDAVNLGAEVNSSAQDRAPDISPDGLTLHFDSDRPGGSGGHDLWATTRPSTDANWAEPENLGPTVNSSVNDNSPSMSADGLSLFFHSSREGGLGLDDLWVTTRPTADANWADPVNLGSTVNSSSWDYGPDISADGLRLYFSSIRPGGHGGFYGDIWVTKRRTVDDPWGEPENIGPMVNGSTNELMPDISADGATLYFCSNDRVVPDSGGETMWATWEASMELVVDFNGDNIVDFGDFCILGQFWQQESSLVDIGPAPCGDGFVDIEDAAAFAKYWLWTPTEEVWGPTPPDGAEDVSAPEVTLNWNLGDVQPGTFKSFHVFFGTDEATVAAAEPADRTGETMDTTYDLTGLDYETQYFWRIDTLWRLTGPPFGRTTKGNVWSFTTSDG